MFLCKENICCWRLVPTFTSQPITNLKLCTTSDKVNMYIITKQKNNKLNLLLQNVQTVHIQRPVDRRFPTQKQGNVHIQQSFCLSSAQCLSPVRGTVGQTWSTATYEHNITMKAKHHPRSSTSSWCSVSSVTPSFTRNPSPTQISSMALISLIRPSKCSHENRNHSQTIHWNQI